MASIHKFTAAVLLAVLLCGCTGEEAAEDTVPARYFRLASCQSENYVTNQACLRFCDAVREKSGGTLVIEP